MSTAPTALAALGQAPDAAPPVDSTASAIEGTALSPRYRILVWMPVVVAIAIAIGMWPFISHALMSNALLNGKILLVMCWGIYTMSGHVERVYREADVFRRGMVWLRRGAAGEQQDPRYGPPAYVSGMLERLHKLGLGHQVYIHSAATEPEIEALEQYLDKKQDLSQFLVGLMVGLGLLGTFIGLLETLVQTSELIGTIAAGAGTAGTNVEEEFAKVVGGLQGPLAGMGTAFSASMFGLVGSILLGFQLVVVRKTAGDFVETVREEVLSLAEASRVNEKVEITERFLATLMADMLEQHRAAGSGLRQVMTSLAELVPQVKAASTVSAELAIRVRQQEEALDRTTATVGGVGKVVPVLTGLAESSSGILDKSSQMNDRVGRMLAFLPEQEKLLTDVGNALSGINSLAEEVRTLRSETGKMREEIRQQGAAVKRMDATLWNVEKGSLREALDDPQAGGPPKPADDRR